MRVDSAPGETAYVELGEPIATGVHQVDSPVFDASAVWTRRDGKVRVSLHGRNLTDKHYKTGGYLFPTLGFEGVVTAFYGPPRTVSATFEYRF